MSITLNGTSGISTPSLDYLTLTRNAVAAYAIKSIQYITSGSGTYTPSTGCRAIFVQVQGAGSGGGGCAAITVGTNVSMGTPGKSGGYAQKLITDLAASYSYSIGDGGPGGAAGANAGTAGGDTTFIGSGVSITAYGGTAASGGSAATLPYILSIAGSSATGGDLNLSGFPTTPGNLRYTYSLIMPVGGCSLFGSGGSATSANGAGSDATGYGAGGGGGCAYSVATARAGGNGTGGLIIITEYY